MRKQILFAVFSIISGLTSFYFLKKGAFGDWALLIPGIIVLPTVWGISVFLIESFLIAIITSFVVAASFLVLWGFSLPYLICATLVLLSLLFGFKKVNKEKTLRIKITPEEIFPKGMWLLFFVMAIIISTGFYFSPKGQELKKGLPIPHWIEERTLALVIPGFSNNLTVDETLNLITRKDKNAPVSEQTRKQILEQVGLADLNLSGQEKINQRPEILDRLISGNINQILKGLKSYLPIIAALTVWQILIWLNKILIPLVVLLDFVIYFIMRKLGFIKIEKIATEKEELKL